VIHQRQQVFKAWRSLFDVAHDGALGLPRDTRSADHAWHACVIYE
jgi:hypothetical protein